MDNFEFTIELIKASAWPLVVGGSILAFKGKIKSDFKSILNKIKLFKIANAEIHMHEQSKPEKPAEAKIQDLEHLRPLDHSGLGKAFEESLKKAVKKIDGNDKKIEILISNLAQQQISNAFEKIYFYIYGTQITILDYLSGVQDGKAVTGSLLPYFNYSKEQSLKINSNATILFEGYMSFLVNGGLVTKEINNDWVITDYGRAFIKYLNGHDFKKDKPF